MPPVDVAAASRPPASSATAPDRPDMRNGQRGQRRIAAADALELLPALGRVEVARGHERESAAGGEFLSAGAGQHDVSGLLHHRARKFDRILDPGEAADGAGVQIAAVHDRGVQFVAAVEREYRAAARIEQGVVLEQHDGAGYRIDARAAGLQHGVACVDGRIQTGAISLFRFTAHFGAR